MSKWISAKDRPPEKSGWYLTYGPQRRCEVLHFDRPRIDWANEYAYGIEVTHWMPLPLPPKED